MTDGPLNDAIDTLSRLVGHVFAGVGLVESGGCEPLSGAPGHDLLADDSALVETVRARIIDGEVHMAFAWPCDTAPDAATHVRVTYLSLAEPPFPGLLGLVLLSPMGDGHGLTPRELEVLGMMVDGFSNRQIAGELVVTSRTVATHVEHILTKLISPSRTHAAVHAQREGLYVPVSRRRTPDAARGA